MTLNNVGNLLGDLGDLAGKEGQCVVRLFSNVNLKNVGYAAGAHSRGYWFQKVKRIFGIVIWCIAFMLAATKSAGLASVADKCQGQIELSCWPCVINSQPTQYRGTGY